MLTDCLNVNRRKLILIYQCFLPLLYDILGHTMDIVTMFLETSTHWCKIENKVWIQQETSEITEAVSGINAQYRGMRAKKV